MTLASLDLTNESTLDAQVCIVGAGAAGITLACELDGSEFKVLLLEAGGLKPDDDLADYYRGTATSPHSNPTEFRRAKFGGTTGIWGGRCVPFDPVDLSLASMCPIAVGRSAMRISPAITRMRCDTVTQVTSISA